MHPASLVLFRRILYVVYPLCAIWFFFFFFYYMLWEMKHWTSVTEFLLNISQPIFLFLLFFFFVFYIVYLFLIYTIFKVKKKGMRTCPPRLSIWQSKVRYSLYRKRAIICKLKSINFAFKTRSLLCLYLIYIK